MPNILRQAKLLWVELAIIKTASDLLRELSRSGYLIFDTQYLFKGDPSAKLRSEFDVSKLGCTSSTGQRRWLGYKTGAWINFLEEFKALKKTEGLIQTDIVCVNRSYLDEFCAALSNM